MTLKERLIIGKVNNHWLSDKKDGPTRINVLGKQAQRKV